MGHSNISCEAKDIYRRLQAVRPAVSPAYTDILEGYEEFVQKKAFISKSGGMPSNI
jgi:hypothetical protein